MEKHLIKKFDHYCYNYENLESIRCSILKNKNALGVTLSLAGLMILNILIVLQVLPFFYEGIQIPLQTTSKPVGSSLFSLTFFNLFLIIINILIISYILNRFGFSNKIIPSIFEEKVSIALLLIFSLSGLAMWYYPIFLIAFVSIGLYLLIIELR